MRGEFGQADAASGGKLVTGRHDGMEGLAAQGRADREIGQFVDIADAEIGDAAAHIVEDRRIHALAHMDLDARPVAAIGGDHSRQPADRDRHHARDHDESAPFLRHLAHALHRDAEIVQHALGDSGEFAPRRRDLDPARAALEQPHAELHLEPLQHAGERRLGNPEPRRGGNEAAVFGQRQHRLELADADVGQRGAGHQAASMRSRLRSRRIGITHLPNRSASSSCR